MTEPDEAAPAALMRREARTLIAYALLAGAALAVMEGVRLALGAAPHAIDNEILLALRSAEDLATPIGPDWLLYAARDVTALAGWPVLTVFTLIFGGYLALRRQWAVLILVLAAVVGQSVVVELLKGAFDRARPDVVPHLSDSANYSFPSGHSASAAAVYLTLAALVSRASADRALRAYVIGVAILMTALIAASRVYLGVHYPTDVLAGLCVGALWASLVWTAAYALQHRRGGRRPGER